MIDIHTHLYFPQYDDDRDETIQRAFAGGMTRMVSVGTAPEDWAQALAITEYDERIRAAVGIHPNHEVGSTEHGVRENTEAHIQALRECIVGNREKIVAIGECGLDYFVRDGGIVLEEEKERQRALFTAQIELAQELKLPLIIHTRPSVGSMDAYEEISSLLRTSYSVLPAVLHCYMGDTERTEKFLTLPNVFFSFTGNITYPVKKPLQGTKDDLTETVKMIPLERILTETDCPFLAPQRHRGNRNEPSYVAEVVEKIAEIKGVSHNRVNDAASRNAEQILGRT
jgi:TatD DNase family protein